MFAGRSGLVLAALAVALLVGAVVTALTGNLHLSFGPLVVGAGLWVFFAVFLRDPDRPVGSHVVSAADGVVNFITTDLGRLTVAVFMNVYDVHVNRFPLGGNIIGIEDGGQGYRLAFRPGASKNRQRRYRLSTAVGEVEVIQMTGWFARRLVSYVKTGETRAKGDRLGMIRFGSRVDVILPADKVRPTVRRGEHVKAGVTTIAEVL